VLSLLIIRPIFQKVMKKSSDVRTNVDSLIGREAVVTQEIAPFKDGFVKVGGEVWLAQSDTIFNEGDIVKVESISGTKVKVTK
jgi:membrane protein implicated in regulation of membrane protease activity